MNTKHLLAGLSAWLLLLQLPGCGVAPPRTADEPFLHKSARTPYSAAICIARNGRSGAGGMQAEERTLGTASWEVVIRSQGAVIAVAQIHDDGVGSSVSILVTGAVRPSRQEFARGLMSGC
jgi:hypothetical protein